MNNIKPNPYVYPYIPFANLSNKDIKQNFVAEKRISVEELRKVIENIKSPQPKIKGDSTAQKILSIFLDENFRFGSPEYITDCASFWNERLSYFIERSLPIQFTILGFPFKVPVPLKTDRIFPDMGEVLSLLRLSIISKEVKKIYEPGATITIFTEGVFGNFSGVSKEDWIKYRESLKNLNEILGFDSVLQIRDLSEMEKSVPDFQERYRQRTAELKSLFDEKDPEFLKKYHGTYSSIYRIVSTKEYDQEILLNVYNNQLKDEEIDDKAREIREVIKRKAHEVIFLYFAYLKVRDDIDYLEKTIPSSLCLSVSPKPYRLGIIPVHKECIRLPYHGVPVYYPKKDLFLIEYLIDIKRSSLSYTLVYFEGDKENKPFYYIANEQFST